jgi:2-polyprenyl-3-methyl-5-hydroxy-6-metoxy-1,4-benzoquinol methylase
MTGSCTYQEFDPDSLNPIGYESQVRIKELEGIKSSLVGKQVLDIGTNSGLVAIHAARWGAKNVLAVDVNRELILSLQEISTRHNLPIAPSVCGFTELSAEIFRSEIVLCLEVIHWLFHQGHQVDMIVSRLDSLTISTLIIETPWDKTEKSIQARMNSGLEDYSLPNLIEKFLLRGFRVEILGFAHYFTDMSHRVLLRFDRM